MWRKVNNPLTKGAKDVMDSLRNEAACTVTPVDLHLTENKETDEERENRIVSKTVEKLKEIMMVG